MQISAQYQLTQAEVWKALWRVAPLQQTGPYAFALALPAFELGSGFQITGHVRFDGDFRLCLVLGALGGAVLLLKQLVGYRRVTVPSAVTVTEDRVMRALPTSTTDVEWHRFVKTRSSPDCWLLYTARRTALIIPKRAFTPEQQQEIEALVRATGTTAGAQPATV